MLIAYSEGRVGIIIADNEGSGIEQVFAKWLSLPSALFRTFLSRVFPVVLIRRVKK